MTKEERGKVLALLRLGRNYVIDVIAMGQIKASILRTRSAPATPSIDTLRADLLAAQSELHERIQLAEIELVTEIAKNV